jgi:hypothetical protein
VNIFLDEPADPAAEETDEVDPRRCFVEVKAAAATAASFSLACEVDMERPLPLTEGAVPPLEEEPAWSIIEDNSDEVEARLAAAEGEDDVDDTFATEAEAEAAAERPEVVGSTE